MTDTPSPDAVAKALQAYRSHQKDWTFLGYNEATAIAVLTEFFGMGRVRNASSKPLNVLSMVGKSRVRAIAEAVKSGLTSEVQRPKSEASEDEGQPKNDPAADGTPAL